MESLNSRQKCTGRPNFIPRADRTLQSGQTGKLGSFRRDLRGTTAVKSKGRGKKSDPGAGSGAARGTKTNAAMYMSNEYRYLKSILFNYYIGHGTGVHCVDMQPC